MSTATVQKPLGRPKVFQRDFIKLSFAADPEFAELIKAEAKKRGISKSELLRSLIEVALTHTEK